LELFLNSQLQDINVNNLAVKRVAHMVQDVSHMTDSSEVEKLSSQSSHKLLL